MNATFCAVGAPLEVEISVKPDRTYDLNISTPTISYLLMMAAGIRRGAQFVEKGMHFWLP